MKLTYAFCTFNRANRLVKLVSEIRQQECPVDFEILAVNNNSQDDTLSILKNLSSLPGAPLRFVTETKQGIVAARNRAIDESLDSDILVFIDDDEIPLPGLLNAAFYAITKEGAQCVGGKITIDFSNTTRPNWLGDELLGFLGQLDYGNDPISILDDITPIWSGNVAYDMKILRNNPELRFDERYTRKGAGVGGGEDADMFKKLLKYKIKIRYQPEMEILHDIDKWRLTKRYFIELHFKSGLKKGQYDWPDYQKSLFGVPLFAINQCFSHIIRTFSMYMTNQPKTLRQAMNASHILGNIIGCHLRWKNNKCI